ncbi:uncharacterized protein H6S33_001894 [Morchella sextelata]|uniref:uncharacterized protein n=1 Tax=Morchella sextelata TaxID=1174677 RepID=UPI001D045697|nr:uncharacterized protein H6S33_001894 [Morchella sextelata]KAH0608760.1 hypothetical protein H6S33_001894 [Morchella sextelata]
MGEAEAEGSRDMIRFPKGKDRPRARARDSAMVYPKAGTAVCTRTEGRTATRAEGDAAKNRKAAKIITADAQGMRDSRRNVN